jgi:hypothetical protein
MSVNDSRVQVAPHPSRRPVLHPGPAGPADSRAAPLSHAAGVYRYKLQAVCLFVLHPGPPPPPAGGHWAAVSRAQCKARPASRGPSHESRPSHGAAPRAAARSTCANFAPAWAAGAGRRAPTRPDPAAVRPARRRGPRPGSMRAPRIRGRRIAAGPGRASGRVA